MIDRFKNKIEKEEQKEKTLDLTSSFLQHKKKFRQLKKRKCVLSSASTSK